MAMASFEGRTVAAYQGRIDVTFTLTIDRKDIHTHPDLSPLERRYAAALADDVDPAGLPGWSVSSVRRAITGLKKKGFLTPGKPEALIVEKKQSTPATDWLTKPAPLDATDGVMFETFSVQQGQPGRDILLGDRNDRFATFCRLYRADGEDSELRSQWLKIENFHSKKDGDHSEMAHLCPVIFKAAQHQTLWVEQGLREYEDPTEWLHRKAFDSPEYAGSPGQPPIEPDSDASWWAKAEAAAEGIRELDNQIEFQPPGAHERPRQCAKRLEAKFRMEKNARGIA